jgi:signal transduction histidine kinase
VLDRPLVVQGEPVGRILVGPRANERRYLEADLAFLAGCARVAAQHLERLALLQAVAAETLAREHLAEVDRLKSEFLAQVAHDLRTPVTGIGWSARNLADGIVGELNGEQREYVQSIAQSCEHLNRLVSNLLEISRLDRGKLELELATIAPALAWRHALGTVAPLAQAKNVALELIESEPGAVARGHADKLIEVAVNLLDNAIKYTAPDSKVTVTIGTQEAGGLAMSVRDRGPGLGGQAPEDLIGRFAQGAPSPSSSRKGFGLGLHIVVTYLELMGGTLTAGDHPEGGAEFTCRLPLATAAPAGQKEGQAP